MAQRNFIVLIGGPGLFQSCDLEHDQTWSNYIVPPQLAAQYNLYKRAPDEKIHWVAYMNPYEFRWLDDSTITPDERRGRPRLDNVRKSAADKVRRTGATSYLNRIMMVATGSGYTYKGIRTPEDFWDYIASFPKASISRVWYFGHASKDGLMLALTHDGACQAGADPKDMIYAKDLKNQSHLADRFDPNTKETSRFYGCYTNGFAGEWHRVFKISVPTEGAERKIDFSSVDKPSSISDILMRLVMTRTCQGDPGWTQNH